MLVNIYIKKRLDGHTKHFLIMKIFAFLLEKTLLKEGNRARDFTEMEQEVNLKEETQDSDDVSRSTVVQHDETSPSVHSKKRKNRSDETFNNAVGLITKCLKEISKT
uniref:Uncharacterized protein n=1 Tax=Lactuca sativa TaxID=4236 RepID=A0A9R1WED4_LACSA|nr:hypothetical protein LSAT_V11C200074470 [Lactuca sativa]